MASWNKALIYDCRKPCMGRVYFIFIVFNKEEGPKGVEAPLLYMALLMMILLKKRDQGNNGEVPGKTASRLYC